jgi:lysophospholipase L1-like esterase
MRTSHPKLSTLVSLSLLSFLLSLYLAEAFLWVIDPRRQLPINGVHNGKLYTWGHEVRHNRFGFRERDFVTPKPQGTFRIMVLGDSLTWGAGLAEEERYTNLLESALNREFDHGPKVEVLNFGVSGGSNGR